MSRRFSRKIVAAVLLAPCALLAGCTLMPNYKRPPLPVADDWPSGPAYGNQKADGTQAPAAADIGWRDVFVDTQLRALIELALANNRDLRGRVECRGGARSVPDPARESVA
jgi:hypothetical protein